MVQDISSGAVSSKDRDQRIQSAKKKLKSYRAKQAQMEKSKRQSMMSTSASSSSLSVSPTRLVGSVLNDASHESQMAMSGSYSDRNSMRLSSSFEKRHSRTLSRSGTGIAVSAGHGRGHSRTGSISLSQNALADGMMAAALGHISQQASLSTSRPLSTHIANTTHSHTRGHSRTGSRSLAASKSRPTSLTGVQKQEQKVWMDEVVSPAEDLFKTPTMNNLPFAAPNADATPQQRAFSLSIPTTTLIQATPKAETSNHARRLSRHARKGSVSTRRESMEIMGGLATQENNRNSRRISSNRWSGLQSASVLFGGGADFAMFEKRRGSVESTSDDEGGDRLTALEKLEGKRPSNSTQNIVQLPSFDDVHGEEAMDKRASLHLLEANAQTTSAERPAAPVVAPIARPLTMTENNTDLCMVIEEEEEEEDTSMSSPVKERGSMDFIDEDEKRRRKEAEQEVVKRNRRGSLTPRPLKLKSRPASLFVAPRSARLTASQSFPELSVEEEQEEEEEEREEENRKETPTTLTPITPSHITPTSWNPALRSLQTPEVLSSPSKETKRAWRSSMPVVANRSPSQFITSPSSTSASSRQGMRALRLGSNASASSTASALVRQHKNHTDSTSSLNSTASSSSAAVSRRGSLLYNASPISSSTSREDVSLSLAKRRGSLLYKTSLLDTASNTSAADQSFKANTSLPVSAPPSTTMTPISTGGVPMSMFEELKSKHQRDVVLLDDTRSKIARLESELTSETDRRVQELAEMERWSAEEKRSLGQRIKDLEASIVQVVQVRDAKEMNLTEERGRTQEELVKVRGDFEDVEAERDMLRDDVDGWRTRCSDLEKSLRIERRVNEDLKRIKLASRQRIKELLVKMQEAGVEIESSSIDEENVSSELIAVLRSPGPSSPSSNPPRDGTISPIHADVGQMPLPQAVQLLKDMRQQIFNLAGSLEHEREQHLLARQEVEEVKANMDRMRGRSMLDETENTTLPTMDSLLSTPEKGMVREISPSTSTPPHHSGYGSPAKSTKKKRNHVFAYDSSMESGFESNEMGSGSVTTYQTSHDENEISLQAKDDEAFVARVQADLAGLGLGTLGTVEEEESILDQEPCLELAGTLPRESLDIESGRRASDVESVAPSTPALEHNHHFTESVPPPVSSNVKEHASMRSSASSSLESQGPPSPLIQTSGSGSSQGYTATTNEYADDVNDDDSYNDVITKEPRPEFIREWSFQQATAAVQMKKKSALLPRTRPKVVTSGLRKNRPMSIEDFFGIMSLDDNQKLPPLPTPTEALEMPPLFIEDNYSTGKSLGYGTSPRYPSSIRAPVPRSSAMYARSMSDRSSTSSGHSSLYNQKISQSQYTPANDSGFAASAIGGGMFSRVASLTSAFSGYLIGNTSNNTDYDSRNTSNSWAVTRREEEIA